MHHSLRVTCSSRRSIIETIVWSKKKYFLLVTEQGEQVGQEGDGPCLQMLLVWMLHLYEGMFYKCPPERVRWHFWGPDDKQSAGEETDKAKRRRRGEGGPEMTMALACLGQGCAPVRSRGTGCENSLAPVVIIYTVKLVLIGKCESSITVMAPRNDNVYIF